MEMRVNRGKTSDRFYPARKHCMVSGVKRVSTYCLPNWITMLRKTVSLDLRIFRHYKPFAPKYGHLPTIRQHYECAALPPSYVGLFSISPIFIDSGSRALAQPILVFPV